MPLVHGTHARGPHFLAAPQVGVPSCGHARPVSPPEVEGLRLTFRLDEQASMCRKSWCRVSLGCC
uniref:Uncharacterized protein n=1 Tax=Arundo donax TaxID=35708 RepID=A0A0A9HVY7_ARUDO